MNKTVQKALKLVAILILALIIYLGYRVHASGRRLIPISVLAVIAGVLFEGKRLSGKWTPFLWIAMGSFVFGMLAFLPAKSETNYNFENHIQMFPYWFIILFAIFSIIFYRDKVVPKLTEGITLLQSMAILYWITDYGFLSSTSILLKAIMGVGLLFSFYAVLNAFTHIRLSPTNRLVLSVWSSVVMLLFAIENVYGVSQNEQIENTAGLTDGFYIGLQFFLLGVSCIYIIQNLIMVIGFLPGKKTFFNEQYFQDIKDLKSKHVKRYSDEQVNRLYALYCVLFSGTVFILNYHFQVLPRHLAIWMVFVVFPLLLAIYESSGKRRAMSKE